MKAEDAKKVVESTFPGLSEYAVLNILYDLFNDEWLDDETDDFLFAIRQKLERVLVT